MSRLITDENEILTLIFENIISSFGLLHNLKFQLSYYRFRNRGSEMTVQGFEIWDSLEGKQRWGTNNIVLFHAQRPIRIITTAINKVRTRSLFLHYKYVRKNKNNTILKIIACLILHSVTSEFLQNSINCSSAFPQPASLRSVNITLSSSSHKLRNHIPLLSGEQRYVNKWSVFLLWHSFRIYFDGLSGQPIFLSGHSSKVSLNDFFHFCNKRQTNSAINQL